jgi:hypothetical protein
MLTPLRFPGTLWLRTLFAAARHVPQIPHPLKRMSFIYFARWTVLDRMPGDRERHPVLMFESNFNLKLFDYIDEFAAVMPWRMRAVWSTSYGYPGLLPTREFNEWVEENQFTPSHYYCAYPAATVTMVRAALAVRDAWPNVDLAPDGFGDVYRDFLTRVQPSLS